MTDINSFNWLTVTFFLAYAVLLLASAGCWTVVLRRRKFGWMQSAGVQPSPLGFIDVVMVFLFWMVGQLVAASMLATVIGAENVSLEQPGIQQVTWLMILSAVSQLVATLLAIALISLRYRSIMSVSFRPERIAEDVKLGLVAFLMIVPPILVVQWTLTSIFPYQHPTLELLSESRETLTIIACWLGAVVVAPFAEEFFFRGIFQGWLQRLSVSSLAGNEVTMGGWDKEIQVGSRPLDQKQKSANPYQSPQADLRQRSAKLEKADSVPIWPIFVSAAVFASVHLGQGPAPVPLFLLGIGLGFLFRQTGSLLPCIIVHFLLNSYSMFWFTLNVFFGETS